MPNNIRSKYAEYIAAGLRMVKEETGKYLPDDTIIVCQPYSELAQFGAIAGIEIYICDIPSSFDFTIAFKSYRVEFKSQLRCFREYLSTYEMGD